LSVWIRVAKSLSCVTAASLAPDGDRLIAAGRDRGLDPFVGDARSLPGRVLEQQPAQGDDLSVPDHDVGRRQGDGALSDLGRRLRGRRSLRGAGGRRGRDDAEREEAGQEPSAGAG
jgi:hypothetical protein